MFKNFISTKIGIMLIGLTLTLLTAGVQQLRVAHYENGMLQAVNHAGELKTALQVKETEAVSLQAAVQKQNDMIKTMTLSANMDRQRRSSDVLKVRVEHRDQAANITHTKAGPEAFNRWLSEYF